MTDHTPSRSCYQRGCTHPDCARINYQYMARLRLEYHRGQRRRCDATQTRHHIERLHAAGWTQAQIARAAGLAHRTIGGITAGAPTISNRTALAILNIPVGPAPDDHRDVDATGTIRRLRALAAIGWPLTELGDRIGMYPTAIGNITRGQLDQVRTTTADRVARAYRELSRIPGPSQRVRNEARAKGWHSPAAWDANIDDPAAEPEVTEPYEAFPKFERDPDRKAEIAHLDSLGESVASIAKQLGNSEKYIRDQLTAIQRERAKAAGRAMRSDLGEAA